MTEEENEDLPILEKRLRWEKPHFYLDEKIFIPKIYSVDEIHSNIPEVTNTIGIRLDGTLSSSLDWKREIEIAQHYLEKGFQLFWILDLGLFNRLKAPLDDQSQFLSLTLSLEHFRDTVWKKFHEETLGVCLYQGSVDFSTQLLWNDKLEANFQESSVSKRLFSRNVAAEYLMLFANRMPDEIPLFLQFDVDCEISLAEEAQLLHRERFDRYHLLVKNHRLPLLFDAQNAKVGVCLPNFNEDHAELEGVFQHLLENKIPFKLIPETFLINEWDGLDHLIVISDSITSQSRRKLQGFCAAGGTVVSVGSSQGLPQEISWDEF